MKTTELKELIPPHVVDVQGHGINEFYTPDQVVEILRLLDVRDRLKDFLSKQQDISEDIQKVINEKFWDMI